MDTQLVAGIVITVVSAIIITVLAITSVSRVNHIEKKNYSNIRQIFKDTTK